MTRSHAGRPFARATTGIPPGPTNTTTVGSEVMKRENRRPRLVRVASVALVVFAGVFVPRAAAFAQQASYTDQQASTGVSVYEAACAACHLADLQGGTGPQLAGTNFRNSWGGRPVSQMLLYVRSSMPHRR
jgi:mono/diheme cytochrome c family protein